MRFVSWEQTGTEKSCITKTLLTRYILLTTANPRKGTFFTVADAQRWDAAKQCPILDRLQFAKIVSRLRGFPETYGDLMSPSRGFQLKYV